MSRSWRFRSFRGSFTRLLTHFIHLIIGGVDEAKEMSKGTNHEKKTELNEMKQPTNPIPFMLFLLLGEWSKWMKVKNAMIK